MSVPEPSFYESIDIEVCHWDGWDYGEPYDQWPVICDSDGTPWEPRETAIEDYMDRAKAVVEAALKDAEKVWLCRYTDFAACFSEDDYARVLYRADHADCGWVLLETP